MHSAHHARETVDLLRQPDYSAGTVASKYARSEPCRLQNLGYHATLWRLVWPYSRLSTWLLTTSVEDFERPSIRKEDNSNTTCELTILILSLPVTFSVTFVWLLPCYSFHSKGVPAMSTVRLTRVFVSQGSAVEKSEYGGRFYSMLGHRYLLSDMPKKLLKLDSNCQSYSKCYRGTLFWLIVSRARCAECCLWLWLSVLIIAFEGALSFLNLGPFISGERNKFWCFLLVYR